MAQVCNQKSNYLMLTSIVYLAMSIVASWGVLFELGNFLQYNLVNNFSLIPLLASLVVYPIFGYVFYRLFKRFDIKTYDFLYGLKGENKVLEVLKKLPNQYAIFQDITLQKSFGNVDYIVVGPTGIFALEVKSGRGKIEYKDNQLTKNGKAFYRNPIKQAKSNAKAVSDLLNENLGVKTFVVPIVVFSSFVDIKLGKHAIDDAYVVSKVWLNSLIEQIHDMEAIDYRRVINLLGEKWDLKK